MTDETAAAPQGEPEPEGPDALAARAAAELAEHGEPQDDATGDYLAGIANAIAATPEAAPTGEVPA